MVAKLTFSTPIAHVLLGSRSVSVRSDVVRLQVGLVALLELQADAVERLLHLSVVLLPGDVELLELAGLVPPPGRLHLLDDAVEVGHLLPDLRDQALHVLRRLAQLVEVDVEAATNACHGVDPPSGELRSVAGAEHATGSGRGQDQEADNTRRRPQDRRRPRSAASWKSPRTATASGTRTRSTASSSRPR